MVLVLWLLVGWCLLVTVLFCGCMLLLVLVGLFVWFVVVVLGLGWVGCGYLGVLFGGLFGLVFREVWLFVICVFVLYLLMLGFWELVDGGLYWLVCGVWFIWCLCLRVFVCRFFVVYVWVVLLLVLLVVVDYLFGCWYCMTLLSLLVLQLLLVGGLWVGFGDAVCGGSWFVSCWVVVLGLVCMISA